MISHAADTSLIAQTAPAVPLVAIDASSPRGDKPYHRNCRSRALDSVARTRPSAFLAGMMSSAPSQTPRSPALAAHPRVIEGRALALDRSPLRNATAAGARCVRKSSRLRSSHQVPTRAMFSRCSRMQSAVAISFDPTRLRSERENFVSIRSREPSTRSTIHKILIVRIQINRFVAEIFVASVIAIKVIRSRTHEVLTRVAWCCSDSRKSPRKYPRGSMLQESKRLPRLCSRKTRHLHSGYACQYAITSVRSRSNTFQSLAKT